MYFLACLYKYNLLWNAVFLHLLNMFVWNFDTRLTSKWPPLASLLSGSVLLHALTRNSDMHVKCVLICRRYLTASCVLSFRNVQRRCNESLYSKSGRIKGQIWHLRTGYSSHLHAWNMPYFYYCGKLVSENNFKHLVYLLLVLLIPVVQELCTRLMYWHVINSFWEQNLELIKVHLVLELLWWSSLGAYPSIVMLQLSNPPLQGSGRSLCH